MLADCQISAMLCGLLLYGGAAVAEDTVPDIEFLEYLGMWEESDEDWLLLEGTIEAETEERSDPVPQGDESMEKDDES
jgi:hypothetical protein